MRFVEPARVGAVRERLALKSPFPESEREAWLVRGEGGLFLVDGEAPTKALDLLAAGLRYHVGRLRDELALEGASWKVPRGEGSAAQRMIALARLRPSAEPLPPAPEGPLLEARSDAERAWLAGWREEGEVLLAWLRTATELPVSSAIGEDGEATASFVWTSRRAALVAVSGLGDVTRHDLPAKALVHHARRGRDEVEAGAWRWRCRLGNEDDFRALGPHVGAAAQARLRFVLERVRGSHPDAARRLLEALEGPLAALERALLDQAEALPEDGLAALEARAPEQARAWATSWGWDARTRRRLAEALRARDAAGRVGLALDEGLRDEALAAAKEPAARAALDASWARRLGEAGRGAEALAVIEARLGELPEAGAYDLVPHAAEADGEEREPGVRARVQLLEATVALEGCPPADRTDAAAAKARLALAQLQPLDAHRLEALARGGADERPPDDAGRAASDDAAEGGAEPPPEGASPDGAPPDERTPDERTPDDAPLGLVARASAAAATLAPGALDPAALPAGPPPPHAPFDEDALRLLRHPIGRSDAFLATVQTLVAAADVPDPSALRAYCARLEPGDAREVFAAAARALDVTAEVYVSRGERTFGCRAYDDRSGAFVLLGGDHLAPDAPRRLGPRGLAFAFGAELAHLRFGHARVSATEVWRGALEVGASSFDLLLGVMPVLRSWKLGEHLGTVTGFFKDGLVAKAKGALGGGANESLAASEVIAAQRLMQLRADRVGLVLAGALAPALRAMLAMAPGDALERAMNEGVGAALSARGEGGELRFPGLALRASALIAFWLDPDFTRLA
ncbi:MAG TPA: hypothetical protein RMH85_25900 [Polyangiaceae bacterium LLY-WYZ-15_(1-7)]|nr:hypothetical protein [Polyangiaceae bacterium LLY-WYZ-15_(1-7)]HJL11935.1 hypothetical protein [Polyangiaceae bacterium LLY-WYZ-15_(1-7)]